MKKTPLIKVQVRYYSYEFGWVVAWKEDGERPSVFRKWMTKQQAIAEGRKVAQKLQPSQLIIRKKDGTFQTEYTYPRSRDPRKSKG